MINNTSTGNMKNVQSIHSIFQDLLKTIQENDKVKEISEEFSKVNTNADRVLFVYTILEQYKLFPDVIKDEKNDDVAIKFREEGNKKFKGKKLREAIEFYTQSLAHAQKDSDNFSKALANRSAALFELKLYEECLTDIEAALDNKYPEDLKPKIMKRKECASSKVNPPREKIHYFQKIPEIPKYSLSSRIECASNLIEIKDSEKHGRHIVAKEDIKIGDILAVEKPFCHILSSEFHSHCHECLSLCYNLLPCPSCTQVLYCSFTCQKNAGKYHKYECNILKTLRTLHLDKMKLLPLKIALLAKDVYSSLPQDVCQQEGDIYKSDRYQEIHNLVGNTNARTVADLFERSTTAAVIYYLMKMHTNLFELKQTEAIFRELILLHFQTAPCNFHEISELARTDEGYFETQEIGAGAFAFLSMFNHSCNPNVVRHCYGSTVVLRAIRSIRSGEQCFDNYGYHFALMSKAERKDDLRKQYFFECACNACEDNWPLLHHLSSTTFDTGITDENILDLRKGNDASAGVICKKILPKMEAIETLQPDRLFSEMQEVLKQCYALFGNVKRI